MYAGSLCIILKDHNNEDLRKAMAASQSRFIKSSAKEKGFKMESVEIKNGKNYSTKPTTVWLTAGLATGIRTELISGWRKLNHYIDYLLVDRDNLGK